MATPYAHAKTPLKNNKTTDQSTSSTTVLEATLRGRQLKGCTRALPAGYAGALLAPAAGDAGAGADERAYVAAATFTGLTYWGHDAAPAASDWQARTLDWLAVAERAHAPVSAADVEAELAQLRQRGGGGGSD